MATIVRTETRKRGVFGMVMWWLFLAYNALMGVAFVAGMKGAGETLQQSAEPAARAGAALGTALGAGVLLAIWLTGALILGLIVALTRGKKVIVERTVD